MFTDGRRLDQLLTAEEYSKVVGILQRAGLPAQVAGACPAVGGEHDDGAVRLRAAAHAPRASLPLDAQLARAGPGARHRRRRPGDAGAAVPRHGQRARGRSGRHPQGRPAHLRPHRRHARDHRAALSGARSWAPSGRCSWCWPRRSAWRPKAFDVAPRRACSSTRNLRHARQGAARHLGEGGVLIAVGALHLPGQQGLVALLREAGYTVTAVE